MTEEPRKHRAGLVIGLLLLASTILGVIAYWRYTVSEKHLHVVFAEMDVKGKGLDADECISATLQWHRTGCAAMRSLCDHAVPMVLTRCLAAKDRKSACDTLDIGPNELSAKWTYRRCKARGVHPPEFRRRDVKACGNAYGSLESFCKSNQQGVVM